VLTHKTKAWAWGPDEDCAFHALKEAVTSAPVLAFPADAGCFKLECDASNFATGTVLSQLQADGEFHPVAFMSKSFTDVERNYEVYDKEMLAIVRALEEWRHFIQGVEEKVDVYTDHRNLGYFRTTQRLNQRQAWWSLFLSQFHFTLIHCPGKLMGKPDALSRRADHPKGKDDNEGLMLLQPAWFEAERWRRSR
jgi:hypothetical protein